MENFANTFNRLRILCYFCWTVGNTQMIHSVEIKAKHFIHVKTKKMCSPH